MNTTLKKETSNITSIDTVATDHGEILMEPDMDSPVEDPQFSEEDDTSTTQTGSRIGSNQPPKEVQMAAADTKRIQIWRAVLVMSILVTGVLVSTLSFTMLNHRYVDEGHSSYESFSEVVSHGYELRFSDLISKTRAMRRAIMLSAMEHGGQFPFYSISNFEAKAYEMRHSALFESIVFAPLVRDHELQAYLEFANQSRGWLDDSKKTYDEIEPGKNRSSEPLTPPFPETLMCVEYLAQQEEYNRVTLHNCSENKELYLPLLHVSPPPFPNTTFHNIDFLSNVVYRDIIEAANKVKDVVFSFVDVDPQKFDFVFGREIHQNVRTHPHGLSVIPIFGNDDDNVLGYLFGIVAWDKYMKNLLPRDVDGIVLVLRDSCGQTMTYHLHGHEVEFIGEGDLHQPQFSMFEVTLNLLVNYPDAEILKKTPGHCTLQLQVYPSDTFFNAYKSNLPLIFSIIVASLFATIAAVFGFYDRFVQSRNRKITGVAERSNAIVGSLFPEAVKERLLAEKENNQEKLLGRYNEERDENGVFKNKPIADLYPEATVLCADIVGFTAWSSVREPSQVFILLETLYSAFDKIADHRRIYKIETVGDCYVAVCGLPQPRKDHAVAMARFARDCMYKLSALTKSLETLLGPDTGDLSMRMGLHSGPVIAGVLRGERSRFQLFGDTMNTAARMESTGERNCIQMSQETADLLIAAGKSKWVKPREQQVYAKGKGNMKTYFLQIHHDAQGSCSNSVDSSEEGTNSQVEKNERHCTVDDVSAKNLRLIEWNLDIMARLLKQIVARRNAIERANLCSTHHESDEGFKRERIPIEEVKEIVEVSSAKWLPENIDHSDTVDLDPKVVEQLRHLLVKVSSMYHENPFHNFEHASHVTMSVTKLLSRIVAPSDIDFEKGKKVDSQSLHDHTYGITSSPLTQFAVIFSAIIHDLDHPGIPNAQLVKDNAEIANRYQNVSVAEQNSVDLALSLLSEDMYKELRYTIAGTKDEAYQFRQLVINIVLATDICDKRLKELRNQRWANAFSNEASIRETQNQTRNRKATIVLEHLIQASDVAHTMQHWHIYRKWNERFFMECYAAYRQGRADSDPSLTWYKGEIGFFDFYIIPLAKKLKECGVFGVCSNEYLDYAEKNRNEWVVRGEEIVNEMVEKAREIWDPRECAAARVA